LSREREREKERERIGRFGGTREKHLMPLALIFHPKICSLSLSLSLSASQGRK
jgi:hypothetical protein